MPNRKICSKCNKIIPFEATCGCRVNAERERNKRKKQEMDEATKLFTSYKWRKFRKTILERDGAYCQRCLIKYNMITTSDLEIHHIKPRSQYPDLIWEKTNCITLCGTCNVQLGTRETLDFPFTFPEENYSYTL